jgi:hypothetical protein
MPQKLLDLFMYLVIVELADVRTDNLIREGQRVLSAQMGCLRINKYCLMTGVIREYCICRCRLEKAVPVCLGLSGDSNCQRIFRCCLDKGILYGQE